MGWNDRLDDEPALPEKCVHCAEPFVPRYDEGGQMFCSNCGCKYINCGRCGEIVPEHEWKDDVSMCNSCWEQTLHMHRSM